MRNRRHTRFFAGFALTVMVCSQPSTPPKVEPTLLIEDFRIARAALEEGHSGIYRYTPKPALDRAFDDAAKVLDHAMSPIEFYRVLAPGGRQHQVRPHFCSPAAGHTAGDKQRGPAVSL